MRGSGGFWNRAGRRSGGNRPLPIVVRGTVTCVGCRTETPFGLLPQGIVHFAIQDEVEVRSCPNCNGVLLVKSNGEWLSVQDIMGKLHPSRWNGGE